MDENNIQLFENKRIRTAWDEEKQEWFFSIVDVCAILTDSDYQAARNYWKWLKGKLKEEGSELVSYTKVGYAHNPIKNAADDTTVSKKNGYSVILTNDNIYQPATIGCAPDLKPFSCIGKPFRS